MICPVTKSKFNPVQIYIINVVTNSCTFSEIASRYRLESSCYSNFLSKVFERYNMSCSVARTGIL